MKPALFRNHSSLRQTRLKPRRTLLGDTDIAAVWNRIGSLLDKLCALSGIELASAMAVWKVECGSLAFVRGRPVLRFEAHVFFNRWGKDHESGFDRHFRFGGRSGIDGARWQNHMFRTDENADFRRYHGDQANEYLAFGLAAKLASRDMAAQCASFGGPQIMGFNHEAIGYPSADAMRQAFGRSERWQACGFFDFCAAKSAIEKLQAQDWLGFAAIYNGPGNADVYAAKIAEAYAEACQLLESL